MPDSSPLWDRLNQDTLHWAQGIPWLSMHAEDCKSAESILSPPHNELILTLSFAPRQVGWLIPAWVDYQRRCLDLVSWRNSGLLPLSFVLGGEGWQFLSRLPKTSFSFRQTRAFGCRARAVPSTVEDCANQQFPQMFPSPAFGPALG